jgi:tetratricopeptide (TPR) repeat protein
LCAALPVAVLAAPGEEAASPEEPGRLDPAIERLEERSERDPENGELLRDLGLAYLDAGRYDKALARLSQASRLLPGDRSISLLTGLCREAREEWAGAIEAYRAYPTADRAPAVGRTVRGRMGRLVRLVYAARATALLEEPPETAPGLLVVRYFDILAETGTYGNLGKAIAELLISDFSRIQDLAVVPRLSYEALRQEVERSRAAGRDPLAVASMDAMLGAGWALGGTILPREESDEIRIDYFLVNNVTGEISPPASLSGPLSDFIALEKRIAFDVLERLGIGLDDEERRAIAAIPTTHFRAFLAYGNALDAEDRGDFAGARASYEQALRFDPHFALAAERAERTMGSSDAIRAIALEEIALPRDRRARGRIERTASMLLPAPLPERGEASDLSNVRPSGGAELLIRVDRP